MGTALAGKINTRPGVVLPEKFIFIPLRSQVPAYIFGYNMRGWLLQLSACVTK
jgi:hypothetical protein